MPNTAANAFWRSPYRLTVSPDCRPSRILVSVR